MTAKYYVTLTDYGASLVAQAHNIASIQLTQLVVGDANGIPYEPIAQKSRIALVNQKATVPVQSVAINGTVTTVTATLEANIGGFNLHEIGLKDNTGKLVYIGNYHGGYKAVIEEGAGGELTIIIDITAESGKDALISIDPNVVTANKQWALDNFVRIPTFEQHVLDNTNQHNDLQNQIINEAQARDAKDYDLQLQVWQEGTSRSDADAVLQQQINNEQTARQNADADLEDRKFNKSGGTIENNLFVNKSIILGEGLYFQYPYDPVTSLTNIILSGNFNITTGKWQFDFKTEDNLDRFTFDKSIECVGSFVARDSNNHSIYSSMFPKVLENSTIFDTSLAAFRFTKPIIAPNLNLIGVGQTWQNVTASRAIGTLYTNDTGRPIDVKISIEGGSIRNKVYVDDELILDQMSTYNTGGPIIGSCFLVPAGSTYKIDAPGGVLHVWSELR